jgi:amino acid adenylation domain-containing protein
MTDRAIDDIYELSPLQGGMLFHALLAPDAALYFEQFSLPWPGRLNSVAFTRAWKQIVSRHSALRTSFHWEDLDKPLQVVHQDAVLDIVWLDWRQRSRAEQDLALEELLATDRTRGFDFGVAPLMRLAVIRWSDAEYQVVISVHHIVIDGWSMQVAFRDFLACYAAACEGREPNLPSCRPYSDFIGWLQQQDLSKAEAYWRRALAGFTAATPLGADERPHRRPGENTQFAEHEINLSSRLTAALQTLGREHQLTLNTIVQGAWAILLHRYSGDDAVLFGTVVSGRPASLHGADDMVGMFINTLAVPTQVRSEMVLLEYLRALQSQLSEAMQFVYSPLVDVQAWSGVPRGTPLFDTLLVFENYPMLNRPATDGSTRDARRQRHVERTNVPLTVIVAPGERVSIKVLSDGNRFCSETITRLLGHLETILEGITISVHETVMRVPMLAEGERRQLLVDWNATATDYPRDQCVHQLIEKQASSTPDAVAVACPGRELTYRELASASTHFANRLRTAGVGPHSRVALCVTRSPEMVVALIGILKAGAAYVPLDPDHPRQRLRTMLEAAGVRAIVTETSLVSQIPPTAPFVCVDAAEPSLPTSQPPIAVEPTQPAYVIFTSGSTGEPKGVQVPHRAVVNFLCSLRETLPLTAHDRVLAITTISFDIAVLELLLPLSIGARVEVATREIAIDGVRLAAHLAARGITVMQGTPATWQLLLESAWTGQPNLHMLCGGEALPWDLAHRLLPLGASLWNLYGPTETTVWSTLQQVTVDGAAETPYVPIGRPIANTQLYVLDCDGAPAPVRVAGELHIGGDGVALGYLNDPARTADRFVRNPFADDAGSRLYRTGDRVRYLPDGTLEFLGRMDHQVKIRGFRVEPGEIEAALAGSERVHECVVVARGDELGDQRLVAYIVPHGGGAPSRADWRQYLEERLPGYMVPSAFVTLTQLPLTPSGKIDRKALPAPERAGGSPVEFVAPASETERIVASIFAEVLGVPRVSVNDDFFADLGGHSLQATQLVSRIGSALGVDLPIRRLFDAPTTSSLAGAIDLLRPSVFAGVQTYEEGEL